VSELLDSPAAGGGPDAKGDAWSAPGESATTRLSDRTLLILTGAMALVLAITVVVAALTLHSPNLQPVPVPSVSQG